MPAAVLIPAVLSHWTGSSPWAMVAECRERATTAAAGYSLVSWQGRTPDRLRHGRRRDVHRDERRGAELEPATGTSSGYATGATGGSRPSAATPTQVAAICDATGAMAALTESRVDPDVPDWGHQGNTVVARPHRGHRLGVLVKAALTQWLADAEPGVRKVVTYNSAANPHMIAINEELGYEVSGPPFLETQISVSHMLGG